jgi:hypothetical protein
MTVPHTIWTAAAAVVTVNLPFGFWRAGTKKFSTPWFVAVHGPVPLVVAIRLLLGIGWRLANLPVLVGAFFLGQLVGGRIRSRGGWGRIGKVGEGGGRWGRVRESRGRQDGA